MKRLIYYPPGCYGTFVNWLCNINKQVLPEDLPFAEFGNSHRYYQTDPGLISPQHKNLYLKSRRDFGVLRTCWPFNVGVKLLNFDCEENFFYKQCSDDLLQTLPCCDKICIIYPNKNSRVWWYQNCCEKIMLSQSIVDKHLGQNDWSFLTLLNPVDRARHHLDLQKLHISFEEFYKKFNKSTALEFEIFQLRQVLAWELQLITLDDYQCWHKIAEDFPQCKFVSLEQLRDQFKTTILEVLNYFEINSDVEHSLDYVESEWTTRQQHRFKDTVINSIVTAILNKQHMDWSNHKLNLFDEVYIEKILHYEHGVELLSANVWPTNTEEFSRIIK